MPDMPKLYSDLVDLGKADGYFEEILEIARWIRLFDGLTNDEIRAVCHYLRCYAAPRQYSVIKEGDSGDYLIVVLTGAAILKHESGAPWGGVAVELSPGEIVGESALLSGAPRRYSCFALSPMDFAVLSRSALHSIALHAPRLGNKLLMNLLQLLSVRMHEACERGLHSLA